MCQYKFAGIGVRCSDNIHCQEGLNCRRFDMRSAVRVCQVGLAGHMEPCTRNKDCLSGYCEQIQHNRLRFVCR